MPDDLTLRVFRARLNYKDVESYTNWDHLMINDYLGITEGTIALSDQIDQNTLQISVNAKNISNLEQLTAGHQVKIYSLNGKLGSVANQISENTLNIGENTLSINDLEQLANRV